MPLFPTTSKYVCQCCTHAIARRQYVSATHTRLYPRSAISKKRQALIQKHEFQLWKAHRIDSLEKKGSEEASASFNGLAEEFEEWKARKLATIAKRRQKGQAVMDQKAPPFDDVASQGTELRLPTVRKFVAHPSADAASVGIRLRLRRMVPSPTKMIGRAQLEEPIESIGGWEKPRLGRLRREDRRIGAAMGSRIGTSEIEIARGYTLDQAQRSSKYEMEDRPTMPTTDSPTERIRRGSGGRVRQVQPLQVRSGARPPQDAPERHARSSGNTSDELIPSSPSRNKAVPVQQTTSTFFQQESSQAALKVHDHFNMYWETYPPTIQQLSRANTFFIKDRKPPRLLSSVAQFRKVLDSDVPEVAFVGRSNVGKSSLLNAVVDANVKDLVARTSATRGFTKTMNFYGIATGSGVTLETDSKAREKIVGQGGLVIVDMPGYGEGSLGSWGVEIMKYIQSRKQLRRVFVLLDAEHGIKDKDRSLLASLRLVGVSHQVILSKMDKLYIPQATDIKHFDKKRGVRLKPKGKVETLHGAMEKLKPEIKPPIGGGALGELLACSSELVVDGRRLGIDHVRYAVLKAVGLDVAPASWSRPEKHKVGETEDMRKVKNLTRKRDQKELKSRNALRARREGRRPLLRRRT